MMDKNNIMKLLLMLILFSSVSCICTASEKWVLLEEETGGYLYLDENTYGSNYLTWSKNTGDTEYNYRVSATLKLVLKDKNVQIIERDYFFYNTRLNITAIRRIFLYVHEDGKVVASFKEDLNAKPKIEQGHKIHGRFCRILMKYDRDNMELLKNVK